MSLIFIQISVILFCVLIPNVKTEVAVDEIEVQNLGCGSDGDCLSTPVDCDSKCGCDNAYYYNETTKQCVLDVQHLMRAVLTIYDPIDPNSANDNSMAAYIQNQANKMFKGITVAVIIFGSCAIICVVSACFYCCTINYSDRSLRGDVKALAKKMNRDQKIKKPVKIPRKVKEESCNVVVEDAGVFVC